MNGRPSGRRRAKSIPVSVVWRTDVSGPAGFGRCGNESISPSESLRLVPGPLDRVFLGCGDCRDGCPGPYHYPGGRYDRPELEVRKMASASFRVADDRVARIYIHGVPKDAKIKVVQDKDGDCRRIEIVGIKILLFDEEEV